MIECLEAVVKNSLLIMHYSELYALFNLNIVKYKIQVDEFTNTGVGEGGGGLP